MGHHHHDRETTARETIRTHLSLQMEHAAVYLEELARALRAGGGTIRSGGELVALQVAAQGELALEAGQEGRHSVIRLEVRWETPIPEPRLEILPRVE